MNLRGKFIRIFFANGFSAFVPLTFLLLFLSASVFAQTGSDTSAASVTDSVSIADTTDSDSVKKNKPNGIDSLNIVFSKDELPDVVTATATDSAVMEVSKNMFYLFGKSKVEYTDITLEAGKIKYNQNNNLLTATPLRDS